MLLLLSLKLLLFVLLQTVIALVPLEFGNGKITYCYAEK